MRFSYNLNCEEIELKTDLGSRKDFTASESDVIDADMPQYYGKGSDYMDDKKKNSRRKPSGPDIVKMILFSIAATLTALIVIFKPYQNLTSDNVEVFAPESSRPVQNLDDAKPDTEGFISGILVSHPSVESAEFDDRTGILTMKFVSSAHLDNNMDIKLFSYQCSSIISELYKNRNIKGFVLSQEISFADKNIVNENIYAYFDRSALDRINMSDWTNNLYEKDNFINFFRDATKYRMGDKLTEDLSQKQKNLLKAPVN